MSFAGVSVVAGGKLLKPSTESAMIYSGMFTTSGSWYNLLVVEGFSHLKDKSNGSCIQGHTFSAGGYQWALLLYPNGDIPENAGFISMYLVLERDLEWSVKVHQQFSFIDEVGKQEPACIRAIEEREFFTAGEAWGQDRFIKVADLEKSQHLKDGCFTIRCDFIIPEAATNFIEVPPSNICLHLNQLLATKVGVDVKFEVGCETFAAHRCVLAARSTVFMAELFGPMKEGTTRAIHVQVLEPNVFKALLGFVYTDSMPEMEAEGEVDKVTWLRHLLTASDRYHLQRLKSLCEETLSGLIGVSSVMAILDLALRHYCFGLKEACLQFLMVQSVANLQQIMATSEWQHIAATNPSILNELIIKPASKA